THAIFSASADLGFEGRGGFAGYDQTSSKCPASLPGVGCFEIYVYDAVTGSLRCASCDPSGAPPTGDANDNVKLESSAGDLSHTSYLNRALSADGHYVFFSSPDALVPEDTNGRYDAYEYDTQTEEVHLLSSG